MSDVITNLVGKRVTFRKYSDYQSKGLLAGRVCAVCVSAARGVEAFLLLIEVDSDPGLPAFDSGLTRRLVTVRTDEDSAEVYIDPEGGAPHA